MKKTIFTIAALILAAFNQTNAQVVTDTTAARQSIVKKPENKPQTTGKFYAIKQKDGTVIFYEIIKGPKGGYYIERVSATGNRYKQYLKPEEMQ